MYEIRMEVSTDAEYSRKMADALATDSREHQPERRCLDASAESDR